jgi:hypothetical protein
MTRSRLAVLVSTVVVVLGLMAGLGALWLNPARAAVGPMPGEARGLVDHKEGAVSGLYEPVAVTLETATGPLPALAFRVARSRRLPAEGAPAPAYLDVLLRGARAAGLPDAWIARLERLRT